MTITKEQIELARKTLETLEAAYKEQEGEAWPKGGDEYYIVDVLGNGERLHVWRNMRWEQRARRHDLIRRTKAEAEKHLFAMNVEADFRACEGARKFSIDKVNYGVSLVGGKAVDRDSWTTISRGWKAIYFDTSEQLEAAIAKVGEANLHTAMRWTELGE